MFSSVVSSPLSLVAMAGRYAAVATPTLLPERPSHTLAPETTIDVACPPSRPQTMRHAAIVTDLILAPAASA